jgi:tRNA G18 (ribose-2'-O)-methylase SpoU
MITKIDQLNDPRIIEFISLKSSLLFQENSILIESHKVISKALKCGLRVKKLLISEGLFSEYSDMFTDVDEIYCLPDSIINLLVGQSYHGGIMAICERPKSNSFPSGQGILVLNGITSPENIGAIIRSATGFNIKNILVDKKSCHPHVKRAIRVSMGNVFFCNIEQTEQLESRLLELKNHGYEIISFANVKKSLSLKKFKFKKKSCLIVGSEGHGIEESIFKISDHIIKIDMNDEVQHFNAACAASIFLYAYYNS